jgi:hypothetical protein
MRGPEGRSESQPLPKETIMTAKIEIDEQVVAGYRTVLQDALTEGTYTSYGISAVLNKILVANGADKIRPQMMYNYARNGLIVKGEKIFGASLRDFTAIEVTEFLIRYCTRNGIVIKFDVTENPDQLALFEVDQVTAE